MSLITIVLASLCMNSTCPGDEKYYIANWNTTMDDRIMESAADIDPKYISDILTQARKERFLELGRELFNQNFTVTTTQTEPLSYTEGEVGNLVGKGAAFDILGIIQKKYGFDYKVITAKNRSLESDGGGVFSQLIQSEADIAAAFTPVFPKFRDVIDYSRALDEGEWVVLMKRPSESATGSGLWAPFTFEVWILILVSLILVGPTIYLLILLQARLCKSDEPPVYPLPQCIWFVYGALLKQGSTISPITDSARILFATWWIFITILTAFYTANLTAFLTLSKFTLPITTARDIGRLKNNWVSQKGSAIEEMVKQVYDYQVLLKGSKYEYLDENGTTILSDWVLKKKYMYIMEKPVVEYLMYDDYMHRTSKDIAENDRCNFVITKFNVMTTPRAFAFKKGFKFYELFNEQIQRLVESGIIKYKTREELPNTEICPHDLGSTERQLRNADLIMTYVIVAAGFGISACVFIAELIYIYFLQSEFDSGAPRFQNLFNPARKNGGANNLFAKRQKPKNNFKFANFEDNNNVKGTLWHEIDGAPPPPPPYHALFNPPFANSPNGVKKTINGRDYWVVNSVFGEDKLIPVRQPSAVLFQYTK